MLATRSILSEGDVSVILTNSIDCAGDVRMSFSGVQMEGLREANRTLPEGEGIFGMIGFSTTLPKTELSRRHEWMSPASEPNRAE